MTSTAHSPWDTQAPFGLNPMGPRGKSISPPEPNFGLNLINPKMSKKDPKTQIGHQLRSSNAYPQFRGRPLLHQYTLYQRIQVWGIYGTIYNYAPFFLRSPMVMFPGPNYVFPIQVPKTSTHFEGRLFSHSVLQSLAAARRPFEDPNHLAL
ncbi:hypothetical protein O181_014892 [Austropuccinia psidii MF-1]|uniref:Uncharacterized protein n=1 Tax=Austropuccinia psidii MF-1 TaxID=1389203 RepID=A0A9Q3C130_9BASI|nr:hypothetical protein [Austropuccinia psidii MF-1]